MATAEGAPGRSQLLPLRPRIEALRSPTSCLPPGMGQATGMGEGAGRRVIEAEKDPENRKIRDKKQNLG